MPRPHDILFYDGHCGLCHRSVLFALARDKDGSRFRFAPLQGESFAETVPAATRRKLPDSIVVLTPDDRLLTRWRAVDRLLSRLGGAWAALARLARLIPRPLMNLAYDAVAAIRLALFPRPQDTCPACESAVRDRFLP
jgi:predicted DCC family thiol-disulfide oxidoreductase YuxK